MSNPMNEGVNTTETKVKTHSLTDHDISDVNSAGSSLSTLVTSEEVARQIKVANGPTARQLQWLCVLMKELCQASPKSKKWIDTRILKRPQL